MPKRQHFINQQLEQHTEKLDWTAQQNSAILISLASLVNLFTDNSARLARIERLLRTKFRDEEQVLMALKATDQALIAEVHRNSDISQAAITALNANTATVADLTQKLSDAIANSGAADDTEVAAALAELKTNNNNVQAATPVIAAAIANTNPSALVPSTPVAAA
jgi:hypothetical protein